MATSRAATTAPLPPKEFPMHKSRRVLVAVSLLAALSGALPFCQDARALPDKGHVQARPAIATELAVFPQAAQPAFHETMLAFDQMFDNYLAEYLKTNPNAATEMGVHDYDAKMADVSKAGIEKEAAWLKASLKKLQAIDRSKLPLNKAHDYDMVVASINGQLLEIENIAAWKNNPDTYSSACTASIFSLIKRDFAPVKERMLSVIAREKQIPAMLAVARQNIEIEKVPRIYAEVALEQMPGIIDFFVTSVPAAFADVKDDALKAEFDNTNKNVIASLNEYQKYIKNDVLSAAKGNFAIGSDLYARKLLYDEMIDEPLEALLKKGYDELHRLQSEFERVGKEIDSKRTPMEVFTDIAKNHPQPDHLIPDVRKVLEDIRTFCIDGKICTVPGEERARVEETPAFMRALTFASMDTPGPFEKKAKEAYYHVTLPEKNWPAEKTEEHMRTFSYPDILNTSVHEAYPGHYVQFLWVNKAPSKVRQVMSCGSNGEGWAHYCEQMMLDEGFGKGDKKLRMVQIHDALLRACRYIAGLEMHTRGMSLQSAIDLFMKEGYQERTNAEREAKRGTMDPTYLVYTLGKLEILDLREKYKQLAGTKYSLKDFHDWFLSLGCPQLKIAREELKHHLMPISNSPATNSSNR